MIALISRIEWGCRLILTIAMIALVTCWISAYIRGLVSAYIKRRSQSGEPPGGDPRPRLLFKKLRADAVVPRYMTTDAAGLDLAAALNAPVELLPGQRAAIDTGLAIKLPAGHEAQIRPRSGLAREQGVTLINTPGTIDADYTGPLVVLLINHGALAVRIEPGQRIAQLVIAPVVQATLWEVDELPTTARGSGGFGSTGRS